MVKSITLQVMSAASQNKTFRYCFIVRHGERADQASDPALREQYDGHSDPILTPLGHQQARETGKFLRAEIARIEQLEGRKFDAINVSASPFARTISTCTEIAKGVGATNINLDY